MERTNAGYRIIKEEFYTFEEDMMFGYCLGKNDKTGNFVTWQITVRPGGGVCYNFGHYFTDGERLTKARRALIDYHQRLFDVYNDKYLKLDIGCAY